MQAKIDSVLSKAVADGAVAAVSAVVCNTDGIVYEGAFGQSAPDGDAMRVDTVGAIMSMTKAITGAAAMQLVEQGKLDLDAPAGEICPHLGKVQVLTGYDEEGQPTFRPPIRPVTLKNLLTHTSGFVYDIWNPDFRRFLARTGQPSVTTLKKAALEVPLMFDPDERWEYGIGIDWVGQMVEAVSGLTLGEYFENYLTGPLGMHDTAFHPTQDMLEKLAVMQIRLQDGSLVVPPAEPPLPETSEPEFEMGGGGLLSSAGDYARFLRMMLSGGTLDGVKVLSPEPVAQMSVNHIGDLRVVNLSSADQTLSQDAEFFPGDPKSWGLTYQINEIPGFTGRPAGTLMWAGLSNCYYWIDLENDVAGVFLTQVLPFADASCLQTYYDFETLVYRELQ